MGESLTFKSVNPHCLEHILGLSEMHEIVVHEDIHDLTGTKLLASGQPVSRAMHEKLTRRRLARPLEASLSVAGGATLDVIVADALKLIEENEVFSAVAGSADARALIRSIQRLPLPGPVKLLLTSAREGKGHTYQHCVATMVCCAGLAARLNLNDRDANNLLLASLIHDVGELYVHPDYLNSGKALAPGEWKHVAAHPCVGHAFIREFTNFPVAVADAILHHHERLDGSGYPFQLKGTDVSPIGSILGVADSLSAIAIRRNIGVRERLMVALRIIPEEFDRSAVAAVSAALAALPPLEPSNAPGNCNELIQPVLVRLDNAHEVAQSLGKTGSRNIEFASKHALATLSNIRKNLRATGIYDPDQLSMILGDPHIAHEILLVTNEISWRLRNLARNLYLRVERLENGSELSTVFGLIAALDPTVQAPA